MSKAVPVAENKASKVGLSPPLQHFYGQRGDFQIFRFRAQYLSEPSNFASGLTRRWSFYGIFNFKKISPVAEIAPSEALRGKDD